MNVLKLLSQINISYLGTLSTVSGAAHLGTLLNLHLGIDLHISLARTYTLRDPDPDRLVYSESYVGVAQA